MAVCFSTYPDAAYSLHKKHFNILKMELVPHAVIVIITFFCFNGSSNAENLPRTVSHCCVPGFMYVITANKEH